MTIVFGTPGYWDRLLELGKLPLTPDDISRSTRQAGRLEARDNTRLDELGSVKDRASFDEWGHAVLAPTDTEPARSLGMPPFTP